jgi:predicted nucleic-acid-binding Zn-ribbon protein
MRKTVTPRGARPATKTNWQQCPKCRHISIDYNHPTYNDLHDELRCTCEICGYVEKFAPSAFAKVVKP